MGEGGGWLERDNSSDRLHEQDSDRGKGVRKSETFTQLVTHTSPCPYPLT